VRRGRGDGGAGCKAGARWEARAGNAGERGAVVLALGCRRCCAGVELEGAHTAGATEA
jgi:hypothetical protein